MPDAYRVVLIAGTGQNGATILCRMLGALPDAVAVGELGHLWDKGLTDDRPCGCRRPFRACPFWAEVGDAGFGGWDLVDAASVTRLRGTLLLRRTPFPHPTALPLILHPAISDRYRRNLVAYGDMLSRLYRGITEASGAGIIVDSMKVPAHVYAVALRPDIQTSIVHLVRDARGIANSNLKLVGRQGEGMRVRRRPLKATARWLWINHSFDVLARRVSTVRVRYEDLVIRPEEELRRITDALGLDAGDLSFISGDLVHLPDDHLVAGNRVRFERDRIVLRPDEGWRTGLSVGQQRLVQFVAGLKLRRYGYDGNGR